MGLLGKVFSLNKNPLITGILNPVGAIFDALTDPSRKAAEEAANAARMQQAQYEQELAMQQQMLQLQQNQAAMASQTGDDSRYATVEAGGTAEATGAIGIRRRKRGADITVGLT